jgi:hypothetical protein
MADNLNGLQQTSEVLILLHFGQQTLAVTPAGKVD